MKNIYEYWNSFDITTKRILKSIISIILYLSIYLLVPPDFPFPVSFAIQSIFSVISIGIILVLYFLPPYSNKRIVLILTSRIVALLYLFFSFRIISIETASAQLRIDNSVFSLLYIPLSILLSIQSLNKFLIAQEDYRVSALILSYIQNINNEVSLWQLKSAINNIPADTLSSEFKSLISKNFSNILAKLKEENFISGFNTMILSREGLALRNYFS